MVSCNENQNLSQAELSNRLNRRQATISDIENGKSEIGVLTLVQFAIELQNQ
jgi:transcriptional regulator with XRE-family HTH domain